jgi:hypothetical protein
VRVEGDALHVEGVAIRCEVDVMPCEGVAMHVEVDAIRCEVDAVPVEGDAMRCEGVAMRFGFVNTQFFRVFKRKPSFHQILKVSSLTHFTSGRTVLHNGTNVSGENL